MRKYSALFLFFVSVFSVQAQNYSNGQAARAVLGQTNFTQGNDNPSQTILGGVSGLAYFNGMLYVADSNRVAATPNDSRIVAFQTGQIPRIHDNLSDDNLTNSDCYLCGFGASFSLGQSSWTPPASNTSCSNTNIDGNSTCFYTNRSQSGMSSATGVATDGHYFAVADTDNNRVLLWNEVPTQMNQNADIVLGQPDFVTLQTPPSATFASASSLRGPQGVWIQNGKLFVADTQNNRVLIWNSIPTQNNQPADLVLGQSSFNTNTAPPPENTSPTVAANQLENPTSVTSDGTHLFISDLGFNRVLIWNEIPTSMDQNADVVVGQPDMVSSVANNPVVCNTYAIGPVAECQTSLNYPRFALSNGTKLFIADGGNDRVLIWDHIPTTNGAPADEVLGEPDFVQDVVSSASISIASTAIDNTGGVDLLPTPQALAYDPATQNLYVSDAYNRRVVVFTPGDNVLPPNSVVNWASEIIRQEGIVQFTITTGGSITSGDIITVTIAGTAYTYTVKSGDTLVTIAQGVVKAINAGSGDPNVDAIFDSTSTTTVSSLYLSSKATNLSYDSISLAAVASNTANLTVLPSGDYLSAGTAATGATGMLVEINGTNLADVSATARLDGVATIPNTLGGVTVYMDGYACPILKTSSTQIVSQIPWSYADRNSTSVYVRTVHADGSVTVTNAMPVYIAPANPGIFDAPAYAGQPRPWPIAMAYHQPGNPTAVVSIDGSVTANNTATITIAGTAYTYTVTSSDTLLTIAQALINKINASDPNVTASLGGAFTRIVLTAKQPGAAGNGITVAGSTSTSATVDVTAYSPSTCCVVTPGSLISPNNPAAPGELITVSAAGLGLIEDENGNPIATLGTGVPYQGTVPNTVESFVSATMGGTTSQVIYAQLPLNSYGIFQVQMVVPQGQATNSATQLNIAQNAFISNTVSIPIGPAVIYTLPAPTAPQTTINEYIDVPGSGKTVSGSLTAQGWAIDSASTVSSVRIAVDGVSVASNNGLATIHIPRPDVCVLYSGPSCPNVGWNIPFDSTQYPDGQHTMDVTTTSTDGSSHTDSQTFYISNNASFTTNPQAAIIDTPAANFVYRGTTTFGGWSISDSSVLTGVNIYIDGAYQGAATYGIPRPDVCAIYTHALNCPGVGWSFQIDTTRISDGSHTITATAVSVSGQGYAVSKTFQVGNWTGTGSTSASIGTPSASAGTLSGTIPVAGWAVDASSKVTSVTVSVDGLSYGEAAFGANRSDVCAIFSGPSCPNVGYNALLDTTQIADGPHTLAITVNLAAGQSATFTRSITVGNSNTAANPINSVIDEPANLAAVSGTFGASGWAVDKSDTIVTVSLSIDGKPTTNAIYGTISRPDVCASFTGLNCPMVGWYASLDSTLLPNGVHVLEETVTSQRGNRATYSRMFTVDNSTSGPGHIYFDKPTTGSNPFLGTAQFSGWALNTAQPVTSLSVTIDGVPYGTAAYNVARPDVCVTYPTSPNCPNVGWTFTVDTTQLTDGQHSLGITENLQDGTYYAFASGFQVANYSTAHPLQIFVDSPVNTTAYGVFGTITVAGWAIDSNGPVSGVSIAVDGVPFGNANYGVSRPDVCSAYPGRAGCPNVGWSFSLNTNLIPNGIHTLDVTGVTSTGQSYTETQQFSVAN